MKTKQRRKDENERKFNMKIT